MNKKITNAAYLKSDAFRSLIERTILTLTGMFGKVRVRFVKKGNYTDGRIISVCPTDPFVKAGKSLQDKQKAVMGFAAHEMGHILFTDFDFMKARFAEIESGNCNIATLYRDEDTFQHIQNIMEDGAIEYFLKKAFPGYISSAIKYLRNIAINAGGDYQDLEKAGGSDYDVLTFFFYDYATGQVEKEGFPDKPELLEAKEKIAEICDKCRKEVEYENRWNYFIEIYRVLLPFLEKARKNGESQEVMKNLPVELSSSWNETDDTKEAAAQVKQRVKEKIRKEEEQGQKKGQDEQNLSGTGNDISGESGKCQQLNGNGQEQNDSNKQSESDSGKSSEEQTAEEIAENEMKAATERSVRQAQKEIEEREKDLARIKNDQEKIDKTKFSQLHDNMKLTYVKVPSGNDDIEYSDIVSSFLQVNTLARKLKKLTSPPKLGVEKNRYSGFLDCGRLYRKDKRIMQQTKKNRATKPSIGILVDQSGSMNGRMKEVKESVIMITEACLKADIPIAVWGHTAEYQKDEVVVMEYLNFGDKRNKTSLINMKALCYTREGMSLKVVYDKILEQKDSTSKILIVIADGNPYHEAAAGRILEGKEAVYDAKLTVKEYGKKGIQTIALALDECYPKLSQLYDKTIAVDSDNLGKKLYELLQKIV